MPKHRDWLYLTGSLLVSDLACVLAAVMLAAWLVSQPPLGTRGSTPGWAFALLILPVFTVIFLTQDLYDPQNLLGGTREYSSVFRACTYGLLAILLITFAIRLTVSREWIALFWVIAIVLVGVTRFTIRHLAYQLRRRGHFTARTIVVGADAHSLSVASQLSEAGSGVQVLGFLDDYIPAGSVLGDGHKVLGAPAALKQVAARTRADEAIVVPQALPWETLQSLLADAAAAPNGLRLHLPAGFYDLLTTRVGLSERNHVPLLTVKKARLSPFETIFKSTLDYSLAVLLLILSSPVLLTTAIWQRLHAPGQILERRRVIGRYGRPFTLLSFRSEEPLGSTIIRKLPGLLNVLRGQLSIVGPQPADVGEAQGRSKLLSIRPGLTGSWRKVEDSKEQAVLDLYYVRNYSIWLDLQVLFSRGISRLTYAAFKRVVDIVGAALLLAVTSPFLAFSLLVVLIDSGWPLIHRRRVVGRGGRQFDAFKVRTMVRDADKVLDEDHQLQTAYGAANKLINDPRTTRSGRWLRRLSLDELPQLINVVRGEMSLVGPRMITQAELADWGETSTLLLSVRPGLTGLWQVSGRQRLTKAERITLDGEYVRRMSVGMDLAILARTVPAVLSSRGAY
jgi:lipopolysaccharide/colanic/teichoic acid biosynthesis glycosyltransferase